jgi:hypothetical protein
MSQFILASKANIQGITQTQFNANTDYYGTSLDFGGAPIIAYASDVPEYATDLYYNGQTLGSTLGGNSRTFVAFDTTSSGVFTNLKIPDAIIQGLKNPVYNYLEVSGTIPLAMNYQLNPNSVSYGIGRLAVGSSTIATTTSKPLTYWFSASNTANQTPTPSVGDSQYFSLVMKVGESIFPASTTIRFLISNPDVNDYALGQGSQLIVAGGGISASTTNIQFKLF